MAKQKSRDELVAEIESLLNRYDKKEKTGDDRWIGRHSPPYRRANAVWLPGHGPIAKALQNHLQRKRLSGFWAKHFNVSEERFIEWREHESTENPRCSKMLAKGGHRCKGKVTGWTMVPNLFFIGATGRCKRHTRGLSEDERIEQLMYTFDCDRQRAKERNSMSREEVSEFYASALASLTSNDS